MGWIVGGLVAVRVGWPGEQKYELSLVIGGLATTLQGLIETRYLARSFRTKQMGRTATT